VFAPHRGANRLSGGACKISYSIRQTVLRHEWRKTCLSYVDAASAAGGDQRLYVLDLLTGLWLTGLECVAGRTTVVEVLGAYTVVFFPQAHKTAAPITKAEKTANVVMYLFIRWILYGVAWLWFEKPTRVIPNGGGMRKTFFAVPCAVKRGHCGSRARVFHRYIAGGRRVF